MGGSPRKSRKEGRSLRREGRSSCVSHRVRGGEGLLRPGGCLFRLLQPRISTAVLHGRRNGQSHPVSILSCCADDGEKVRRGEKTLCMARQKISSLTEAISRRLLR